MKIAAGIIIAIGGWVFLVAFTGADAGYGREVVNFHSVAIANNVILLGYAVTLWGVIEESVNKFVAASSKTAAKSTANSSSGEEEASSGAPFEVWSDEELQARKVKLQTALSKF